MSISAGRTALTAQLNTLTGVKGYSQPPKAPKPRDCWPLISTIERGPGQTFSYEWRVIAWLGQDVNSAQTLADELLTTLADGLESVAFVLGASFITIQTEAGEAFALEIRTLRE